MLRFSLDHIRLFLLLLIRRKNFKFHNKFSVLGPRNAVKLSKPMKMKDLKAERDKKAIADELSTLPEGLEVLVYGDGEVKVLDSDS